MAQIASLISIELIAVACCCWFMGATAEENIKNPSRTERQYSLNGDYDVPYYDSLMEMPSFSYIPETRANGYFNRPFYTSAPTNSGERTFQTLLNLLSGRPLCPACPTCPSCPGCPTCPSCPKVPVIPAEAITLAPVAERCLTANIEINSDDLTTCSSVSAAPSGIIDVTFAAAQTVTIGIVAVAPNTKVTLTCTAIPTGTNLGAKTQAGPIAEKTPVPSPKGFLQIIASAGTAATDKKQLKCSWKSS